MNARKKEYLELLKQSFNELKYIEFIKNLLNLEPSDFNANLSEKPTSNKQCKDEIKSYKYIAKYNDGYNDIGVFIVKLKNTTTTNARNMQRNFVASLLSKYDLDASIVAFYSDTETEWRLSFVKKELTFTEIGIKTQITPAKRCSYLVGENESVHTAEEYLLDLLKITDRKINLKDIEDAFSVERVTKKFFEEYKEKYLKLQEYLNDNQDFMTEAKRGDFTSSEFSKKLMGQIVFLYFLQKKGWLGVQLIPNELTRNEYNSLIEKLDCVSQKIINTYFELDDDKYVIIKNTIRQVEDQDLLNLTNVFKDTNFNKPWGSGKKNFIRSIFKQARIEHKNFFDNYLEPLFYKGLNEKRDNQFFKLFNCKIPFLNGGLFEPISDYRWSDAQFNIADEMFSNNDNSGILDFLDRYNFTIDEEEPLEKDIAVDPEMLGKIFENLLEVDDRKSKGAFYTPRDIVYYMCQESIANYLVNNLNIDYKEILNFIKYGDLMSQLDLEYLLEDNNKEHVLGDTIYNNILAIDKALIDVKVADPAVGSGAFSLGILTEIVKLRNNLSNYMIIQDELGIIKISDLYGTEQEKRNIYDMKLQTIENCIFAVDVEPSAVDITKLRLWLTLIVDFPSYEEPRPLPNLDCKIMQGNSLVDEYKDIPLFSERILHNSMRKNAKKIEVSPYEQQVHIQQTLNIFDNEINFDDYIEKMLELQKKYFSTSDNKQKKYLKEKIDKIQKDMVEVSLLQEPEKLENFRNEAKKRQKPWFIWKLEFYDVFKEKGGFDIIIGNPPYKTYGLRNNENLKDDNKKYYLKKFINSAEYKINLYPMFMELAYMLSNEKATISYIVPDSFLVGKYYSKIRNLILSESSIINLMLIKAEVFESASVGQSVVFEFDKSKKKQAMNVMLCNSLNSLNQEKYLKFNYSQNYFKKMDNQAFVLLFTEQDLKLVNSIRNNSEKQIKDVIKFRSGLISKIGQNQIKSDINLGEGWGKGIFSGESVKRYKVIYKNQYLCYKKELIKSGGVGTVNYFEPKLFVRQTGDRITCAVDNDNLLAINNVHIGNLVYGNEPEDLYYITAILNSTIMDRYYKIISLEEGRTLAQIDIDTLEKLPLPKNEKNKGKIIEICKTIIEDNAYELEDELERLIEESYDI